MWAPGRLPGPIERCAGCGRMIEMPCLACQAEAARRRSVSRRAVAISRRGAEAQRIGSTAEIALRSPRALRETETDLSPDLDDDQQARLESLQAAKRAAGEFPRPGPAPIQERVVSEDVLAAECLSSND